MTSITRRTFIGGLMASTAVAATPGFSGAFPGLDHLEGETVTVLHPSPVIELLRPVDVADLDHFMDVVARQIHEVTALPDPLIKGELREVEGFQMIVRAGP